jgi:hypothetical protein
MNSGHVVRTNNPRAARLGNMIGRRDLKMEGADGKIKPNNL